MLKIKDFVDLKELEKFGFEKFTSEYIFYGYGSWITYRIEVIKSTRELFLCVCSGEDCSVPADECYEKLFDLIQAGLVEKVEE